MAQLFHGTFIHTIDGKLQILQDSYVLVENGIIKSVSKEKPAGDYELIETKPNQMIIPGLVDTHIHAPQYVFAGCGFDLPLLEWLNTYTFPAEAKFSDVEHARKVYEAVVDRTLAHGTTTACYFATLWTESSKLLAEICKKRGQRAFVGKVSMDRNSPDNYIEKTDDAIKNAAEFVDNFSGNDLVQPIVTPRFVPTCTPELMKSLNGITKKHPGILIQSHVCENEGEISWVKELHPECPNYTSVYDEFGLLNEHTVLAHGVHLNDDEIKLLAKTGAAIAHCPSSNFMLYSGIADVRKLLDGGVKVGLGTDVAGGPSPSIIDSMRNALICSRSQLFQHRKEGKEYKPLETPDVFALATERGAEVLNLGDKIGNFVVGKQFDALVVDMTKGVCDCFCDEKPTDLLDKFVQRADDRNIIRVYVNGKLVKKLE